MTIESTRRFRNYDDQKQTDIASVNVSRFEPSYIEKSIRRLAILQDVSSLRSPAEIQAALDRWRHCLFEGQVKRLEHWLVAQ